MIDNLNLPPLPIIKDRLFDSALPNLPALPNIPDLPNISDIPELPELPDSSENINFPEIPQTEIKLSSKLINPRTGKSSLKIVIFIGSALFLLQIFYLFIRSDETIDLSDLSKNERMRLIEVTKATYYKSTKIDMVLNSKKDEIIVATNIKGSHILYLTLTSLDNKILSSSKIVIKAKARLENQFARFNRLNIITGKGFVPGYYLVQIIGHDRGIKNVFINLYNKILPFNKLNKTERLIFSQSLLLTKLSVIAFNNSLLNFHKKLKKSRLAPVVDRLEQYKTLMALLEQIVNRYSESLTSIRYGSKIDGFVKYYSRNIAPLLQGMILDNAYKQQNKKRKNNYEPLFDFASKIGLFVTTIVNDTKAVRKLRKLEKSRLLNSLIGKYEILKDEGKIKIFELEQNISIY